MFARQLTAERLAEARRYFTEIPFDSLAVVRMGPPVDPDRTAARQKRPAVHDEMVSDEYASMIDDRPLTRVIRLERPKESECALADCVVAAAVAGGDHATADHQPNVTVGAGIVPGGFRLVVDPSLLSYLDLEVREDHFLSIGARIDAFGHC
jgi:hypothetical protein